MSKTTPIKIVVVGTGLIGPRHAEAVVKDPDAELTCIVDPNPAAEAVALRFGCPLYKSIQDMLSAPNKPYAALVCTPNHTHVPLSKELLEAGLHVLCEKLISTDITSGQELIKCAETHKLKLLIGHHRRFKRFIIATKKALPSLGRLIAINGLWTTYKPPEYFDPPTHWRRCDSAGVVLINLIHEIDILHHLFGPIVRVYAEETISQRSFPAEEGTAITLRFANGIVGTFILSDAVVSPHSFESGTGENPMIPRTGEDCYRIFGSEGSLSVPDMTIWRYSSSVRSWAERLDRESLDVEDMAVPFELQLGHFVRVIRGEEEPRCSGVDGLRAMAVCEAIRSL
ncbi:hypothetical protein BCR34DRAFT_485686 [Clohesyomyces aquaticus]|uniref:Oxidoreductase n=1 Tax=Clohesyomyces aquaticus TaxID=1231657 RepID=A0A1Y1ZJI9_9PLEO|nr:hypothetical protein BCR34DRAFT_485686 [Clohesyomyces aquaticus]